MSFFQNITQRRTRTKSLSKTSTIDPTIDVINTSNLTLDGPTNNMPNISDDNDENGHIQEIQKQIEELKLQLSAAHEEIDNLSIENTELKLLLT